jgi:hypothetical protein
METIIFLANKSQLRREFTDGVNVFQQQKKKKKTKRKIELNVGAITSLVVFFER